jgi:polar amino acid transport system substrate-binding protein
MKSNLVKFIPIFLVISILAIFSTGCGSSNKDAGNKKQSENSSANSSNGDLLEQIKTKGKLVVGTEAAFEPFEFVQDGKIVGYGSDILAFIVEDLGVELEQIDLPWQGILPGLDSNRFDFVATAVSITPERANKYEFTVPIADGTLALLVRKGDDSIKKPEDMAGKVVGSQLSSGQMTMLKKYNETLKKSGKGVKEIKEYVSYPEAYQDLVAGRIDAVANSYANLSTVIKKQPDDFEVVGTFGEPMWFSWVLRKEDKDLANYLNEKIIELKETGQLAKMQEKWFGFTMDTPEEDFLP